MKHIDLERIFKDRILIFVGCSGYDESNAKKVAEEFEKNLYTVNVI